MTRDGMSSLSLGVRHGGGQREQKMRTTSKGGGGGLRKIVGSADKTWTSATAREELRIRGIGVRTGETDLRKVVSKIRQSQIQKKF